MTRGRLREIGLRAGILAGLGAVAVSAGLLALRWALDQQASVVAERLGPAFVRAVQALAVSLASGLPAYLALGAVIGALVGLGVAEAIWTSVRPGATRAFDEASGAAATPASRATPISDPSPPS